MSLTALCAAFVCQVASPVLADEPNVIATTSAEVPPDLNRTERLKFPKMRLISVPVEVFGETHEFIVCTAIRNGMMLSSFHDKLATVEVPKDFKLPPSVPGTEFFPFPELKIGQQHPERFRSPGVMSVTPKANEVITSHQSAAHGVIAMDYLQSKVLRVNAEGEFAELKSFSTSTGGHQERIQLVGGVPKVLIRLPEEGYTSALVDTANYLNVTLEEKLFAKLIQKKQIVVNQPVSQYQGHHFGRAGVLNYLELGPYRLSNVPVEESSQTLIGLKFLSKFDVEFDFANRVARFTPANDFERPQSRNRSGVALKFNGAQGIAVVLTPGGPAEAAGIRQGDRVITLNGGELSRLTHPEILEMMSRPATEVTLGIERDNVVTDVVVKLSNEFDPFPPPTVYQTSASEIDFDPYD